MSNKVTPCVTIMICVAGCSSTTTYDLPHTSNFPAPEFDWSEISEDRLKPDKLPERIERLRAIRKAQKAGKPITVEMPVKVLQEKPPASPVLATKFEGVPDTYLRGIPAKPKAAPAKPFFTPLKAKAPTPPAPIKTAQAILKPLTEKLPPQAVVVPEPIDYANYVSVGPEYFGLDSEIAAYVVSRSPNAPPQRQPNRVAEAEPIIIRPQILVAEANRPIVVSGPIMPLPRLRPVRQTPDPTPLPAWEVAAIVPSQPDPQPRRAPSEPAPRVPIRKTADRPAATSPRDELIEKIEGRRNLRVVTDPPKTSGWSTAVQKALAEPAPSRDEAPVFRVRVSPSEPVKTNVVSLDDTFAPVITAFPPDLSVVTSDELAADGSIAPVPRTKPRREQQAIQVASTVAGVTTQRVKRTPSKAANDVQPASTCLVNRGSNDRMILICEGVDVSQAEVFRAVVEGESAFRGLRSFDQTPAVIASYGFNPERFNAMSQGPRSARDLAFLRALRNSGKQIRVKGRPFDLYLMKGDKRLATVLIEQVSDVEMPASIRAN